MDLDINLRQVTAHKLSRSDMPIAFGASEGGEPLTNVKKRLDKRKVYISTPQGSTSNDVAPAVHLRLGSHRINIEKAKLVFGAFPVVIQLSDWVEVVETGREICDIDVDEFRRDLYRGKRK